MLAELRQQLSHLPRGLRTRFAPSPTGHLHLGHAASAVFVWGMAQAIEAEVILRLEDHDRIRVKQEYEDSILEDLSWLGLIQGTPKFFRQSSQTSRYQKVAELLRKHGLTYACNCSRREIQERTGEGSKDEICYDGACRYKQLAEQRAGLRVVLEVKDLSFDDLWCGPQSQRPSEQCGDLLIRDRDGNWTYNFAVTVDDAEEEVDLVIRGQDILSATSRQLQLRQLLGIFRPLRFLHHPLILESSGEKLSKRFGSTSLRSMREQGMEPESVLGQAAFSVGLIHQPRALSVRELKDIFR